jgi:MFS transporter, DHA2 family, multidrug resistance protein
MPSPVETRRWLILAIAASALFLICVDMTVLFIALPALTRDLGASNTERLWILNAYSLIVAGLLPGLGTLGDRYGHRRLFMIGLGVFGCASVIAAYAPSPAVLIAARALLGIGGATMMPATLAIIRDTFVNAHERAVAIGIWSGIAAGGMAFGPVIAGLLLEHFWWGSVFLINVPVVTLALLLAWLVIPHKPAPGGAPWDLISSMQILVALTALTYAIKEFAHQPFAIVRFAIALLVGIVSLVAYLRRQARLPQPLIDLSLFRIRGFSGAFAAATLGTAGVVGLELVMSQYMQLVLGHSPLQAALVLLPSAMGGLLSGPFAGRLLRKVAAPALAGCGFAFAAACACSLALNPVLSGGFALPQTLMMFGIGLGIGATVTCASSVIMNAAPPERGGMAASIEEVGFELGGTLGVAVFGSLMTVAYAMSLTLPAEIAPVAASVRDSLDEAVRAAETLATQPAAALLANAKAAFSRATMVVLVGIAVLWLGAAVGIKLADVRGRRQR